MTGWAAGVARTVRRLHRQHPAGREREHSHHDQRGEGRPAQTLVVVRRNGHFSNLHKHRFVNRRLLRINSGFAPALKRYRDISAQLRRCSAKSDAAPDRFHARASAPGRLKAGEGLAGAGWKRFSRNAFVTTKTLEKAIAPAASMGENSVPLIG